MKKLHWDIPSPFGKVSVDVKKYPGIIEISFIHLAFNKTIALNKNKVVEEIKKVLEWIIT